MSKKRKKHKNGKHNRLETIVLATLILDLIARVIELVKTILE